MTLIIIVVIKAVKHFLLFWAQHFKDEIVLHGDAWMVHGRVFTVRYEKYIAD